MEGKQTGIAAVFCIMFGFLEFLFRLLVLILLICTLIGAIVLVVDMTEGRHSSHAMEKLITPYLWTKI